jgi:hypothetical protein
MYKKLLECPYCNESLEGRDPGNHVRWCKKNPKHDQYLKKARGPGSGLAAMQSLDSRKKSREGVIRAHERGAYKDAKYNRIGTPHTEETKRKLSDIGLKQTHRRLVKSCRNYTCKDGSIVLLDSSWEELLAKRLDELDIKWIRPKEPIPYELEGKMHNYFPDFYLIDYDLLLDPKNPHAVLVQKEKLDVLKKVLPNLVILESERDCREFVI